MNYYLQYIIEGVFSKGSVRLDYMTRPIYTCFTVNDYQVNKLKKMTGRGKALYDSLGGAMEKLFDWLGGTREKVFDWLGGTRAVCSLEAPDD